MRPFLVFLDELIEQRTMTDATWSVLVRQVGERQLIEVSMIVGHYQFRWRSLNALRVEIAENLLGPDNIAASVGSPGS